MQDEIQSFFGGKPEFELTITRGAEINTAVLLDKSLHESRELEIPQLNQSAITVFSRGFHPPTPLIAKFDLRRYNKISLIWLILTSKVIHKKGQ